MYRNELFRRECDDQELLFEFMANDDGDEGYYVWSGLFVWTLRWKFHIDLEYVSHPSGLKIAVNPSDSTSR